MTRFRFSKSLCGLVLVAAGCSDTTPPAAPFTFNRPEHVEFVCIDAAGSSDGSAAPKTVEDCKAESGRSLAGDADKCRAAEYAAPLKTDPGQDPQVCCIPRLILPLPCCATDTPLNPTLNFEKGERDSVCGEGDPALHALVTQSTRGEVAAVDLEEREVLDSDSRIPGYTFVDVGGLPRAIVTPPHMPGNENLGPPWTYVAGAEEQSLRAVATCHFRDGAGCGPEAERAASEMVIALPAQPSDMVFVEPDNALWLTLPSVSALARVALPTEGQAAFESKDADSFQIDFFELPVVPDRAPGDAVKEDSEYVSACGLGYPLSLAESEVAMPLTAPAMGLGVSSPTRLRFVPATEADPESALLLVADAKQPFIHALSLEGGRVRVRDHIATGAPIRDFALTAAVPKTAQDPRMGAGADKDPTFGADENRYLYAIDDRDGSVMVQSFAYDNGTITATPLRAPNSFSRRDRLALTVAATAIDVVDNRALSNGLVCDWGRNEAIDTETDTAETQVEKDQSALSEAQEAYDAAGGDDKAPPALRAALTDAQERYDASLGVFSMRRAERSILDNAGPGTLRGVFVVVTTLAGRLEVFDVHDLDLYCRGEQSCEGDTALINSEDAAGVAVRRHARRLSRVAEPELTATDSSLFAPIECEEGKRYEAAFADVSATGGAATGGGMQADPTADEKPILCVAQDPWLQPAPSFSAGWESRVIGAGVLRGQLGADGRLQGPAGFDLCTRGILGEGLEPGYPGDQVVITGAPPSYAPADCALPEESEYHFKITKSFADHLELAEDGGATLAEVVRCYPDVIRFDVRAREAYMVFPQSVLPPHRIEADADGTCIVDPERDPRLVSRARRGERFENAFVSFQLPPATPDEPTRDSLITMQATGFNSPFSAAVYLGAGESNPSLPVSVRYLSLTGDVYVVDTAQGLRRFALTPFAADTTPFR